MGDQNKMKASQQYYFREGKLELSMLEDEEDNEISSQSFKDKPVLKVSEDVYETLHTMGQFLTQACQPNQGIKGQEEETKIELIEDEYAKDTNTTLGTCDDLEIDWEQVELEQKVMEEDKASKIFKEEEHLENRYVYKSVLEENLREISSNKEDILIQADIDEIMETYFEGKQKPCLQTEQMKKLKEHIENQINILRQAK